MPTITTMSASPLIELMSTFTTSAASVWTPSALNQSNGCSLKKCRAVESKGVDKKLFSSLLLQPAPQPAHRVHQRIKFLVVPQHREIKPNRRRIPRSVGPLMFHQPIRRARTNRVRIVYTAAGDCAQGEAGFLGGAGRAFAAAEAAVGVLDGEEKLERHCSLVR